MDQDPFVVSFTICRRGERGVGTFVELVHGRRFVENAVPDDGTCLNSGDEEEDGFHCVVSSFNVWSVYSSRLFVGMLGWLALPGWIGAIVIYAMDEEDPNISG